MGGHRKVSAQCRKDSDMAMPLDIEHYNLNEPWVTDEEYGEWLETMHVDPYEILDDFPALVEGEVEE